MTELKFHAQIGGSVNIGHDLADPTKPGMTIPLTLEIPVDKEHPMTFSYKAADEKIPYVVPVGQFIDWAVEKLGVEMAIEDLPEAVREFSVAIFEMTICSDGTFKIRLEMGEQGAEHEWKPGIWQPIEQVPVSFSAISMILEKSKVE